MSKCDEHVFNSAVTSAERELCSGNKTEASPTYLPTFLKPALPTNLLPHCSPNQELSAVVAGRDSGRPGGRWLQGARPMASTSTFWR